MGDERVEAFRNGEAANKGLGVGDEVEDLEDQGVREPIEAVHFELRKGERESCFLRRRSESVGPSFDRKGIERWGPQIA